MTVSLSWTGSGYSYSYGGYYNYKDQYNNLRSANFQGNAGGFTSASITVPASTYSLTYQVTTTCIDGTTATSSSASFYF